MSAIKGAVTLDRWCKRTTWWRFTRKSLLCGWPMDNVVNTGGVKVQVERIEMALDQALRKLGLVSSFLRRPLPTSGWARRRGGLRKQAAGRDTENALLSSLREQLDRFELPRRFVYLPSWLRRDGEDRPASDSATRWQLRRASTLLD